MKNSHITSSLSLSLPNYTILSILCQYFLLKNFLLTVYFLLLTKPITQKRQIKSRFFGYLFTVLTVLTVFFYSYIGKIYIVFFIVSGIYIVLYIRVCFLPLTTVNMLTEFVYFAYKYKYNLLHFHQFCNF